MSKHRRERNRPVTYAMLYPRLVSVAKQHGYALALHGSIARDMDIVAVPWVEQAGHPDKLIEAMAKKLGGTKAGKPNRRPHGRLSYVIHLLDVFFQDKKPFYLDISVMHRHRANNMERKV